MTRNPYLDEIAENYVPEDFDARALGVLAIAHELREMNRLAAEAAAPTRIVSHVQAPISPEALRAQTAAALPDEEDER